MLLPLFYLLSRSTNSPETQFILLRLCVVCPEPARFMFLWQWTWLCVFLSVTFFCVCDRSWETGTHSCSGSVRLECSECEHSSWWKLHRTSGWFLWSFNHRLVTDSNVWHFSEEWLIWSAVGLPEQQFLPEWTGRLSPSGTTEAGGLDSNWLCLFCAGGRSGRCDPEGQKHTCKKSCSVGLWASPSTLTLSLTHTHTPASRLCTEDTPCVNVRETVCVLEL